MDFYKCDEKQVRQEINSKLEDLTIEEIKQRQSIEGYNELKSKKKTNPFVIFLKQFLDFLVIILIISTIVSFVFGEISSGIVILVVITINAILGTVQEIKAQKSIESLQKLSAPMAKVIRNNEVILIPSREVVRGDKLLLEAGDYIAADARIINCNSLKVDESPLTGESVPVEKTEDVILKDDIPLADRKNMVYAGCYVTYGRAEAIVTNIGMETEIGKIANLLNNAKEKKTPLQKNLDKFGMYLSISIITLCLVILLVQIFALKQPWLNAIMFAISLAVAAIPEALSSIVSIVLAFGTQKMAKQGAIMRQLKAVESLGSISIICSDKTGTLTQNKMIVEHYYKDNIDYDFTKEDSDISLHNIEGLLIPSILCNDATQEIGDPTEICLVDVGYKYELSEHTLRDKYKRISELPFDSDRKLMSVLVKDNTDYKMITKGAVDQLILRCKYILKDNQEILLNEDDKQKIYDMNLHYSENGLRVLAFGYKKLDNEKHLTLDDEDDLVFVGLISMMDPPRVESKQAVEDCKRANITPIMITGDHIITASAIARRIGILYDNYKAVEGKEIDSLSDEELKEFVKDIRVYARVTPEHKIRIVKAWQSLGNIVAMTGDGVNDAPALKQADVGVAMGITGTEVSKEAASMVLTDDNFATIVKAIENGRNLYANIKRSIQFLIGGNLAGILVVLLCSCLALPVPFTAVQLLFINLLTDSLPAISLGFEKPNPSIMDEKPRKANSNIMDKNFILYVIFESLTMFAFVFGAYMIGYNMDLANKAKGLETTYCSTLAFGTMCMSRLFHAYSSKDKKFVGFRRLFDNKFMLIAFSVGFVLITLVLCVPGVCTIFDVQRLNIINFLIVFGMAFGSFVSVLLVKSSVFYIQKAVINKNNNKVKKA